MNIPRDNAGPATHVANADPPGVIVAGMHRSATSLVTSVFAARGWRTSGPMLAPSQHNRHGYFEVWHIHELHKRVLIRHGASWDSAARLRTLRRRRALSLTPYAEEIDAIVADLREGGTPWIWKNPRATLFLEDWARRFPRLSS